MVLVAKDKELIAKLLQATDIVFFAPQNQMIWSFTLVAWKGFAVSSLSLDTKAVPDY